MSGGAFGRLFRKRHDDPAPAPSVVVAPAPSRPALYFGYFGSDDAQVSETADHTNLLFAAFGSDAELAARIAAAGMPCILDVSDCLFTTDGRMPRGLLRGIDSEPKLHRRFDALGDALQHVVALYLIDEPERESNVSAGDICIAATTARDVAKAHGINPALHICYGDGKDYRGIEFIDWAGVDAYGKGAGVMQDDVQSLKAALRGEQRLVLYPGGASPWKNDPRPFYAYAQTDPQVVAIVAFIWLAEHDGIINNGMADAYREVGKAIIGATA